MIKVNSNTKLTEANAACWHEQWKKDLPRYKNDYELFLNRGIDGKCKMKIPFAKKLVITSSSATIGSGVVLTANENIQNNKKQLATFNEILRLYGKQSMNYHRAGMVTAGCICGVAYELAYASSDEKPVPKVAKFPATNAFVVYDDTVESNSLYGVTVDFYKQENKDFVKFVIYDNKNKYEFTTEGTLLNAIDKLSKDELLPLEKPHYMGRVPLTEYHNNDEAQGDFEQVIDLMYDRNTIHETNLDDLVKIAKNYIHALNTKLAGETGAEKAETRNQTTKEKILETETDGMNPNDGISILSKLENYSSVDVYGGDVDSKIYDCSLVPDLSSDKFAGNASGTAIEIKQLPFKKYVESKDVHIEKLERRRLKQYSHFLSQRSPELYEDIDSADVTVTVKRNWIENQLEVAQIIATLKATMLYSDEYLTGKMFDTTYAQELKRLTIEAEHKAKQVLTMPEPNNAELENIKAMARAEAAKLEPTNGSLTQLKGTIASTGLTNEASA